jgi:hypothetical protein
MRGDSTEWSRAHEQRDSRWVFRFASAEEGPACFIVRHGSGQKLGYVAAPGCY